MKKSASPPQLVPTVASSGQGHVRFSYMFAQYDSPWKEGPGPSLEEQSIATQFSRSAFFFDQAGKATNPNSMVALQSAALIFAVACGEHLDVMLADGRIPPDQLPRRKKLAYRSLLNVIRNYEMHLCALPPIDGDYWIGPTTLYGTATVQLVEAVPRKWRRNGRVETNRPLVLAVRGGRVVVFDESRCKAVELAYAIQQHLTDLGALLSELFPRSIVKRT